MGPGRRAVMTLTAAAALAGCGSAMGATREARRTPTTGRALTPSWVARTKGAAWISRLRRSRSAPFVRGTGVGR